MLQHSYQSIKMLAMLYIYLVLIICITDQVKWPNAHECCIPLSLTD
jgi:hypothetical protein